MPSYNEVISAALDKVRPKIIDQITKDSQALSYFYKKKTAYSPIHDETKMKALLYRKDGRVKELPEVATHQRVICFVDEDGIASVCHKINEASHWSQVAYFVEAGTDHNFVRENADARRKANLISWEYHRELKDVADRIEKLPDVWPIPEAKYIEAPKPSTESIEILKAQIEELKEKMEFDKAEFKAKQLAAKEYAALKAAQQKLDNEKYNIKSVSKQTNWNPPYQQIMFENKLVTMDEANNALICYEEQEQQIPWTPEPKANKVKPKPAPVIEVIGEQVERMFVLGGDSE